MPFILIEKKSIGYKYILSKISFKFCNSRHVFFLFFFKMAFEFNTIEGNFESMHVLLA